MPTKRLSQAKAAMGDALEPFVVAALETESPQTGHQLSNLVNKVPASILAELKEAYIADGKKIPAEKAIVNQALSTHKGRGYIVLRKPLRFVRVSPAPAPAPAPDPDPAPSHVVVVPAVGPAPVDMKVVLLPSSGYASTGDALLERITYATSGVGGGACVTSTSPLQYAEMAQGSLCASAMHHMFDGALNPEFGNNLQAADERFHFTANDVVFKSFESKVPLQIAGELKKYAASRATVHNVSLFGHATCLYATNITNGGLTRLAVTIINSGLGVDNHESTQHLWHTVVLEANDLADACNYLASVLYYTEMFAKGGLLKTPAPKRGTLFWDKEDQFKQCVMIKRKKNGGTSKARITKIRRRWQNYIPNAIRDIKKRNKQENNYSFLYNTLASGADGIPALPEKKIEVKQTPQAKHWTDTTNPCVFPALPVRPGVSVTTGHGLEAHLPASRFKALQVVGRAVVEVFKQWRARLLAPGSMNRAEDYFVLAANLRLDTKKANKHVKLMAAPQRGGSCTWYSHLWAMVGVRVVTLAADETLDLGGIRAGAVTLAEDLRFLGRLVMAQSFGVPPRLRLSPSRHTQVVTQAPMLWQHNMYALNVVQPALVMREFGRLMAVFQGRSMPACLTDNRTDSQLASTWGSTLSLLTGLKPPFHAFSPSQQPALFDSHVRTPVSSAEAMAAGKKAAVRYLSALGGAFTAKTPSAALVAFRGKVNDIVTTVEKQYDAHEFKKYERNSRGKMTHVCNSACTEEQLAFFLRYYKHHNVMYNGFWERLMASMPQDMSPADAFNAARGMDFVNAMLGIVGDDRTKEKRARTGVTFPAIKALGKATVKRGTFPKENTALVAMGGGSEANIEEVKLRWLRFNTRIGARHNDMRVSVGGTHLNTSWVFKAMFRAWHNGLFFDIADPRVRGIEREENIVDRFSDCYGVCLAHIPLYTICSFLTGTRSQGDPVHRHFLMSAVPPSLYRDTLFKFMVESIEEEGSGWVAWLVPTRADDRDKRSFGHQGIPGVTIEEINTADMYMEGATEALREQAMTLDTYDRAREVALSAAVGRPLLMATGGRVTGGRNDDALQYMGQDYGISASPERNNSLYRDLFDPTLLAVDAQKEVGYGVKVTASHDAVSIIKALPGPRNILVRAVRSVRRGDMGNEAPRLQSLWVDEKPALTNPSLSHWPYLRWFPRQGVTLVVPSTTNPLNHTVTFLTDTRNNTHILHTNAEKAVESTASSFKGTNAVTMAVAPNLVGLRPTLSQIVEWEAALEPVGLPPLLARTPYFSKDKHSGIPWAYVLHNTTPGKVPASSKSADMEAFRSLNSLQKPDREAWRALLDGTVPPDAMGGLPELAPLRDDTTALLRDLFLHFAPNEAARKAARATAREALGVAPETKEGEEGAAVDAFVAETAACPPNKAVDDEHIRRAAALRDRWQAWIMGGAAAKAMAANPASETSACFPAFVRANAGLIADLTEARASHTVLDRLHRSMAAALVASTPMTPGAASGSASGSAYATACLSVRAEVNAALWNGMAPEALALYFLPSMRAASFLRPVASYAGKPRPWADVVFESWFGRPVRPTQWADVERMDTLAQRQAAGATKVKPPAQVYQIMMGKGKSSVLTPVLVLRMAARMRKDLTRQIVVVVPRHLLAQAKEALLPMWWCLGGSPSPEAFAVVTATDLKLAYLRDRCAISVAGGPASGHNALPPKQSRMLLVDEFDSIYQPTQSNLNVIPSTATQEAVMPSRTMFDFLHATLDAGVAAPSDAALAADPHMTRASPDMFKDVVKGTVASAAGMAYRESFGMRVVEGTRVVLRGITPEALEGAYGPPVAMPYARKDTPIIGSDFSSPLLTITLTLRVLMDADYHFKNPLLQCWLLVMRKLVRPEIKACCPDNATVADLLKASDVSPMKVRVLASAVNACPNRIARRNLAAAFVFHATQKFVFKPSARSNLSFLDPVGPERLSKVYWQAAFTGTVSYAVPNYGTQEETRGGLFDQAPLRDDDEVMHTYAACKAAANLQVKGATEAARETAFIRMVARQRADAAVDVAGVLRSMSVYEVVAALRLESPALQKRSMVFVDDDDVKRVCGPWSEEKQAEVVAAQSAASAASPVASEATVANSHLLRGEVAGFEKERAVFLGSTAFNRARDVFMFYSQKHIVGVDFADQPLGMKALVTVRRSTTLTDAAQGMFRMRKLNRGHSIDFAVVGGGDADPGTGADTYAALGVAEKGALEASNTLHLTQLMKAVARAQAEKGKACHLEALLRNPYDVKDATASDPMDKGFMMERLEKNIWGEAGPPATPPATYSEAKAALEAADPAAIVQVVYSTASDSIQVQNQVQRVTAHDMERDAEEEAEVTVEKVKEMETTGAAFARLLSAPCGGLLPPPPTFDGSKDEPHMLLLMHKGEFADAPVFMSMFLMAINAATAYDNNIDMSTPKFAVVRVAAPKFAVARVPGPDGATAAWILVQGLAIAPALALWPVYHVQTSALLNGCLFRDEAPGIRPPMFLSLFRATTPAAVILAPEEEEAVIGAVRDEPVVSMITAAMLRFRVFSGRALLTMGLQPSSLLKSSSDNAIANEAINKSWKTGTMNDKMVRKWRTRAQEILKASGARYKSPYFLVNREMEATSS